MAFQCAQSVKSHYLSMSVRMLRLPGLTVQPGWTIFELALRTKIEQQGIFMSSISEFKELAVKGNMIDMAVGIVIGAAVGTVVSSLVDDIIMPPIGMLLSGVDFFNLELVLKRAND